MHTEHERLSRLDSSITHHDPLAGDACAWFNLTLAALVCGRRPPQSVSVVGRAAAKRKPRASSKAFRG